MLTYSFENTGRDSLYEHLYKCIRKDILQGKIRSGEKLPSKRSFAKNLGVSVITVENAYAQLVAEGYIYSVPKSGYYAAEINNNLLTPRGAGYAVPNASGQRAFRQAEIQSGQKASGQAEIQSGQKAFRQAEIQSGQKASGQVELQPDQRESQMKNGALRGTIASADQRAVEQFLLADLVSSRTDPGQFPFTIWARLLRQVLSEKQEALMNNAPGAGIRELREAIAGYLLQYQGMEVTAEQIIIGAGTEYLYGLLIQLLGQDKVYALEDPGYLKMAKIYESHGVKTAYIPMDESGVRIDSLKASGGDVMHISPSHHYPTGITTPIGRRYELLNWANKQEGRYIIEDDYDCEFRLAGRPIPSLQSIDRLGRVIYMNTFTKSLTSTIRISYMVLPPGLLEEFQEKLGFYACTVSNFEQYTLAEFIAGGYFEKHINRMRNHYKGRRDALLSAISASPLAPRVSIHEADAGLHFLMKVNTSLSDSDLIRRAALSGIRIACLSGYYHGLKAAKAPVQHTVIVNYSGLSEAEIPRIVEGLWEAWFK